MDGRDTQGQATATGRDSRGAMAWLRAVPGVRALTGYRREWLSKDVVAGIALTTLLVPQGMAYAELAGLPPITGLYTTILCLLGYAVCGPSRILVLGPDSSLGPMIAATVLPLIAADGDPRRAVALASMLGLMVAGIMILASVARLGFIADLISKPTMIGYMNGLALTILIGQLPKLLGFKVDADNLVGECAGLVRKLADGATVPAAAAVGVSGLVLILLLERLLPKVPAVLAMVALAILAASVLDLHEHGVGLVGPLPEGFPRSRFPTYGSTTWSRCSRAPSGSPWCRWPTPSPTRRRSRPAPDRRCAATRRWRGSGRRTSRPGSSRASPSARAAPVPRSPSAPVRRPSSPAWSARS